MTTLAEFQRQFGAALFGDEDALERAGALIESNAVMSGADHVRIYRQTVLGTLVSTLGDIFPVTRRLVGERFFDAMATRFVPSAPSRSPDLADYGGDFPGFIREFAPAAELPYLADVALLEWSWHRAFHAADEAPLDGDALRRAAQHQSGGIVFRLPVSATLLESAFPIRRIWQVNQPGFDGDAAVNLDAGGERLIVWRAGVRELRIEALDAPAWALLRRIDAGATLQALSESQGFAQQLPRCAERGWLGGFDTV